MSDSLELLVNPKFGTPGVKVLPTAGFQLAKAVITAWPDYAPTPLRDPAGSAVVPIRTKGPVSASAASSRLVTLMR